MMKQLKKKLDDGETLLGCFLNLGSLLTAEIMGRAGFDFVVIDLEHGSGNEADVLPQLQALEATNAGVIVRVESHERQRAHRVLDLGLRSANLQEHGSDHVGCRRRILLAQTIDVPWVKASTGAGCLT